jgi:hypothetical protein
MAVLALQPVNASLRRLRAPRMISASTLGRLHCIDEQGMSHAIAPSRMSLRLRRRNGG